MKIVGISGSPRSGNTESLIKEILKGASASGANTDLIKLKEKKFSACCGYYKCYTTNVCKVKDDFKEIHKLIKSADVLVLGSPTFFNNVSGIMKIFMDRTNPYFTNESYKGKRAVLVVTGEWSMRSLKSCERALKDFCMCHKIKVLKSVKYLTKHGDSSVKDEKVLKNCFSIGKKLV